MKRVQGKNIVGYVTVHVEGENPEHFFQACASEKIPVWDIKKLSKNRCAGKIYLYHINRIKGVEHRFNYEINLINKRGYIHYLSNLWIRKEVILSFLICSVIIFAMANIVWKIEVSGVSTDIEKKINEQLTQYGLYEGAWSYSLEPLDIIQQDILNTIPELMYIGIQKKGTTYLVGGVEKLIANKEEALPTQHLVATKDGIIQKMFVKHGQPVVEVNDFVQKGDLLVSGMIGEDDGEENSSNELLAADGEVYATTWYEVAVTSSLYHHYEKLSGEYIMKYALEFGNIQIPIWGFKNAPFKQTFIETEKNPIQFLKWEMPLQLIQKKIYNEESFTEKRTEEEAIEVAINHVKADLQVKLGKDTQVLKYYVLHDTVENGKVKLNLYISILENIAKATPIH